MTDITVNQPTPPASTNDLPGQTTFRPLGGSPLPEGQAMLSTMNGIVTNMETALVETQKVSKEILADAERVSRLQGITWRAASEMMGGGRGMAPWAAYSQSGMLGLPGNQGTVVAMAAHEGERTIARAFAPGGGGGGGVGPIPAHEAQERAARAAGIGEGRAQQHYGGPVPAGFQLPGTWDEGKKFDLGSLRQNVARGVNRQVSEWGGSSQQQLRDQYGRFAGFRPAPAGSQAEVDVIRKYDAAGKLVRDEAGKGIIEEIGSGGWKYEGSAMVRNVAGSMANGEGIGSAISSAAPAVGKALGVAGAVYMGANTALDFAESQRSQNMAFQSVLGGSNAEGFKERMKQNVFRLGLRGTMGGGDAEAIYKAGLDAYGTQRGMRNSYQSAAVSMYGAGIGSDESIQLLNLAAKNGNENISLLADSVLRLGATARDAGVNAKEARDNFAAAMNGLSSTTSGAAQIKTAAATAAVQTNLGARLNDVGFSGQDSPLGQRLIAQRLGVSYTDLNSSLNGNVQVNVPGQGLMPGAQALAIGKDRMLNSATSMVDPNGKMRREILAKVKAIEAQTGDKVTSGQMERIASEVQANNPTLADPMRVRSLLTAVGRVNGLTDSTAMTFFARSSTNQHLNESQYEDNEKGSQFKKLSGRGAGDAVAAATDNFKKSKNYKDAKSFVQDKLGYKIGLDEQRDFIRGTVDDGKGRAGSRRSTSDQFRNALVNRVGRGQKVDQSFMSLYEARDDLKDARFVVKTKGGGTTSVEYGELIRDYADQIRANPDDILIQGGKYAGQDLSEAFGIKGTGGKARSAREDARSGISKEAGRKKANSKNKGDGKVEIYLTPEAQKLIGVRAWGSAEESRANGVQPSSSASTPPEDRWN